MDKLPGSLVALILEPIEGLDNEQDTVLLALDLVALKLSGVDLVLVCAVQAGVASGIVRRRRYWMTMAKATLSSSQLRLRSDAASRGLVVSLASHTGGRPCRPCTHLADAGAGAG